jgi:Holliday junction DNA helicase RuvA
MIGWLRGERIQTWEQGGRRGVVVACSGVGYEVQLTRRDQEAQTNAPCTLWVHQVQREDGSNLYGFPQQRDRDLFRTLIAVNGVGPQMALSLLDCCTAPDLVTAIIEGDLKRLTQAQGIGKRTAERIAVELRDRLGAWAAESDEVSLSIVDRSDVKALPIQPESLQELQLTLETLGYEDLEIRRAMRAVASGSEVPEDNDGEGWLRASLRWLSESA